MIRRLVGFEVRLYTSLSGVRSRMFLMVSGQHPKRWANSVLVYSLVSYFSRIEIQSDTATMMGLLQVFKNVGKVERLFIQAL